MNKARRKRIEEIVGKIIDCREELEAIRDEEQEALDNMPENLQNSERAEIASDTIDNIDYALDSLTEAEDNLNDIL